MLAKSAIQAAMAALLALTVAQAANAQQPHGNGVQNQPTQAATTNAFPGFAPITNGPGVTSTPSPLGAPTVESDRVAPAVSTPSSQPVLQQVRVRQVRP